MAPGAGELAHAECGGPRWRHRHVLTGNFALSMMLESSVLAPVLSQAVASTRQACRHRHRAGRTHRVRQRLERDDLTVMAIASRDQSAKRSGLLPSQRRRRRFIPRVLPDSAANRDTPRSSNSLCHIRTAW